MRLHALVAVLLLASQAMGAGVDLPICRTPAVCPTFGAGAMSVTGAVTCATLAASGAATIGGTLGVTGDTTLSGNANVTGTLGVTGASTLGTASSTNLSAPTLASSTTVKGAGGLGVTYGLSAATATITGTGAAFSVPNGSASFSGAVFVGLQLSTQAAGTAGTAVTALCDAGSFATGGGCICGSGVALTDTVGKYNCAIKGCVPTGYTCQDGGGTGGACAAQVLCSRLQ